MSKHILVTGACGYKGSVLVPKLLDKGYRVTALDTQWFGNSLPDHANLINVKADVRDLAEDRLSGIDTIIHLASIANDPCGDLNPKLTWEVSALATMQLADMAKRKGINATLPVFQHAIPWTRQRIPITQVCCINFTRAHLFS